jgi:ribosomal protein S18 acetylase RimI-like enzyme
MINIIIRTMIHALWLFILTTGFIPATTGFAQRLLPSWTTTSERLTSYEEERSSTTTVSGVNGQTSVSSPPKSPGINIAPQEKILENFQTNWGINDAKISKKRYSKNNNAHVRDSRRDQESTSSEQQRIPFIIENIGRGEKNEIQEIVNLCIDVFFNAQEQSDINLQEVFDTKSLDATSKTRKMTQQKSIPPWKSMQLAYLRNFQTGEILARNTFNKEQYVNLIVARRVYAAPHSGTNKKNIRGLNKLRRVYLIDDDDDNAYQIFNADLLNTSSMKKNGDGSSATGYNMVAGEIIGYCEVSEKNFGLGGNYESMTQKRRNTSTAATPGENKLRPYLSNLSVVDYARRSGVGSKLLDAAEAAVRNWNAGHTEIVLQVEEDNTNAIQFYKRRGWEFVFADPTCRRYDTSGFFLRECRITKYAMIKRLDTITPDAINDSDERNSATSFIEKFMNSFFSK